MVQILCPDGQIVKPGQDAFPGFHGLLNTADGQEQLPADATEVRVGHAGDEIHHQSCRGVGVQVPLGDSFELFFAVLVVIGKSATTY